MTTTEDTLARIRKRPVGVYVVCVLLLLIGVVHGNDVYRLVQGLPAVQFPRLSSVLPHYVVSSSLTVVAVLCVVGLLAGRQWAWHLTMMLLGFGLFIAIWSYFGGLEPFITMFLQSLAVLYMNLRDVQDYYKQPEPGLVGPAQ